MLCFLSSKSRDVIADQAQLRASETDVRHAIEIMGFDQCSERPVAENGKSARFLADRGVYIGDVPDTHYYYR
jgi:hypothetical protein